MKTLYSLVVVTVITALSVNVINQKKTTDKVYNGRDFDSISIAMRKANDSILKVNREKTIKVVNKVKKLDSVNVVMKQELKEVKQDLKVTEKELLATNNELSDNEKELKLKPKEIIVTKIIEKKKNFWGREKTDTLTIHKDSINKL